MLLHIPAMNWEREAPMTSNDDHQPRPKEESLDPVRRMVLGRSRDVGIDLARLSRAAARNATYMHQYIFRQSPKFLPEDVRGIVSELLGIPEDQLRGIQPAKRSPLAPPIGTSGVPIPVQQTVIPNPRADQMPVFCDGAPINLCKADEWMIRPPLLQSAGNAFAVWISRDRGRRLSQGDLAFVQGMQTARVGDAVAVIHECNLLAIGDLIEVGNGFVRVAEGGENPARIKIEAGDRLLKVVAAQFG
jgi:hypothetical protein